MRNYTPDSQERLSCPSVQVLDAYNSLPTEYRRRKFMEGSWRPVVDWSNGWCSERQRLPMPYVTPFQAALDVCVPKHIQVSNVHLKVANYLVAAECTDVDDDLLMEEMIANNALLRAWNVPDHTLTRAVQAKINVARRQILRDQMKLRLVLANEGRDAAAKLLAQMVRRPGLCSVQGVFDVLSQSAQDDLRAIGDFIRRTGPKLEDAISLVPGALDQVEGVSSVIGGAAADFAATSASARSMFDKCSGMMEKIMDTYVELVQPVSLIKVLQGTCLLFRVIEAICDPNKARVALTILEFLVFIEIDGTQMLSVFKWISGAHQLKVAPNEAQVQDFSPMSILFALISVMACGGIPSMGFLDKATKYARSFNAFVPACSNVSDLMTYLSDKIGPMLHSAFYAACPVASLRDALLDGKYTKWIESTERCFLPDFKETLICSKAAQDHVDKLYEEGLSYYKSIADSSVKPSGLFASVSKHWESVRKLKILRDTMEGQNSVRPRPFYVYLAGDTSVGKSVVSSRVSQALAPEEWDRDKLLYTKNVEDTYWSGYWEGFFSVGLDDLAQSSEGKDLLTVISAMSNAPYLLNMPALEDGPSGAAKGCPFSARLFIACSNQAYPRSAAVTNLAAEWRRRDVLWSLSVKPEYANDLGHLDITKTPQVVLDRSDHLLWQRMDPNNDQPSGRIGVPMGTREAMLLMRQMFQAHVKAQAALLNSFTSGEFLEWLREDVPEADDDAVSMVSCVTDLAPTMVQVQSLSSEAAGAVINQVTCTEPVPCIRRERKVGRNVMEYQRLTKAHEVEMKNLASELVEPTVEAKNLVKIWEEKTRPIFSMFAKYGKVICLGLGILAGAFSTFLTMRAGSHKDPHVTVAANVEGGAMASGSAVQRAHNPTTHVVNPAILVHAQSGEKTQHAVLIDKLKKQQVVQTFRLGEKFSYGLGLFVGGRLALFNLHMFMDEDGEIIKDGVELTWRISNKKPFYEYTHKFERKRLSTFMKKVNGNDVFKDFCLYEYPVTLQCFPDIRSQFGNYEDYDNGCSTQGALLLWDILEDSHTVLVTPKITHIDEYVGYMSNDSVGTTNGYMFRGTDGLEYRLATSKGYCGAPLLTSDPSRERKILGIHRSGTVTSAGIGMGYVEIVCQRDIDLVWNRTKQIEGSPKVGLEVLQKTVTVQNKLLSMPEIIALGELAPNRGTSLPRNSSLRPSSIFEECYEHTTEPSVLHPSDQRYNAELGSPLWNSLSKQGVSFYTEDSDELEAIVSDIEDELLYNSDDGCLRRILTEDESINGVPGYEFLDSLTFNTSAGYPYKKDAPGKSKAHLFSYKSPDTDTREVNNALLRRLLDEQWMSWYLGVRPIDYVMDCLKDERRPLQKIEKGSTRSFNVCSAHFVMNFRRLFLPFFAYLMKNRGVTSIAVGTNPFAEWDEMTRYLKKHASQFFGGDYAKFDGKMMPQIIWKICTMANKWFSDEYDRARLTVFEHLCFAVHICQLLVYLTTHCNPSGQPGTTVFNCIFNMYLIRKAWRLLAPPEFRDLFWFRKFVTAKVLGDDNIIGAANEVAPWFNLGTYAAAMATIGIEYTPPDKGEITDVIGNIERWTFLKFGWRFDESIKVGEYLPVMDVDVIHELTNWIRKGEQEVEATVANCNDSLNFAFFHGREFFDEHRRKIMSAFGSVGLPPPVLLSWPELRTRFIAGDLGVWSVGLEEKIKMVQCQSGRITIPLESTSQIITSSTSRADTPGELQTTSPQHFSSTDDLGVITADQTTKEVVQRTSGDVKIMSGVTQYMPDKVWSIEDTGRKMAFHATYVWTTAQTPGTLVTPGWRVPYDLLSDATQSLGWNAFAYARPNVRVTVRLQAHRFAQGCIKICYIPGFGTLTAASKKLLNMSNILSLPGAFMEACTSGTSVIDIPFQNVQGWIRTKSPGIYDIIGCLFVVVVSSLAVPVSSPTQVSFTVAVEILDPQFRVLDPSTLATWSKMQQVQGFMDFINGIGNIVEKATGVVKNIAGAVASPLSGIIGALDYPTISMQTDQVALRNPTLPYAVGIDHSTKFNLTPAAQVLSTSATFGTKDRETLFRNIVSKWGYLGRFTWSVSTPPGTLAFTDLMTPLTGAMGNVLTALAGAKPTKWVNGTLANMMPLEYVTIPHRFWSGGMRYRLIVFASAFHTGQLIVQYWPGRFTVPPAVDNQRTARWFEIFELSQACHEFEFVIPYTSPTPAKLVPNGRETLIIGSDMIVNPETYCCGVISVSILTALQAPASMTNELDVLIMKAGGEDYRVFYPSMFNRSIMPAGFTAGVMRLAQVQSGTADTANLKGPEAQVGAPILAPVKSSYDAVTHFGDSYDDCVTEMKRFNQVYQIQNLAVSGPTILTKTVSVADMLNAKGLVIGPGPADPIPERFLTLFHYWTTLFRFWHGSLRFKVFMSHAYGVEEATRRLGQYILYVQYHNGYDAISSEGPAQDSFGFISSNPQLHLPRGFAMDLATAPVGMNYLEFQLPYASICECMKTINSMEIPSEGYADMPFNPGFLTFGIRSPVVADLDVDVMLDIHMAVGDEYIMGGYCGVPSQMSLYSVEPDHYLEPGMVRASAKKTVLPSSEPGKKKMIRRPVSSDDEFETVDRMAEVQGALLSRSTPQGKVKWMVFPYHVPCVLAEFQKDDLLLCRTLKVIRKMRIEAYRALSLALMENWGPARFAQQREEWDREIAKFNDIFGVVFGMKIFPIPLVRTGVASLAIIQMMEMMNKSPEVVEFASNWKPQVFSLVQYATESMNYTYRRAIEENPRIPNEVQSAVYAQPVRPSFEFDALDMVQELMDFEKERMSNFAFGDFDAVDEEGIEWQYLNGFRDVFSRDLYVASNEQFDESVEETRRVMRNRDLAQQG